MTKIIGFLLFTAIFVATASAFIRITEIGSNRLEDELNEIDVIEIDIIKNDEFQEYLANRPESHVEHLVPSTNVNAVLSYTTGSRLSGQFFYSSSIFERKSVVTSNNLSDFKNNLILQVID